MRSYQQLYSARPASRIIQGESRGHRALEQSRLRLICVAVFFALCFSALSLRLVEVSLMGGGDMPFKRLVSNPELLLQRDDDLDISKASEATYMVRRDISDRHGMLIATSIPTASLVANPTILRHEDQLAAALNTIFPELERSALIRQLRNKHQRFVYLKRHLTPAQQEAVNNLGAPGLFFEPDTRRVYPYGALFSHVLGYVGVDNQGLAGLEQSLERRLSDPLETAPLLLSLDLRAQAILREELARSMKEFSAIGATGILADVATGEILALVNLPEFNPQRPLAGGVETRFNRASQGVYEMGSTFKTFTVAAALEAGIVGVNDGYDATNPIRVANFTIGDTHPKKRWLSVAEIFAYSSNIGTVKMALDLGTKRQQEFLKTMGLMEPVAVELPERTRPLTPKIWREINTMTIAYGHGMSVTPLHVVQAMIPLVNGGIAHKLTLLKRDGSESVAGTRVVSEATSKTIRQLLRLVVAHGTAQLADVAGYQVGGKTGTAEKNTAGVYDPNAKLVSFVGIFPARQPQYVMLMMIDEPKGTKETHGYATGGWVSAPAAGRVISRLAPLLGVAPDFAYHDAEIDSWWQQAELRERNATVGRARPGEEGGVHAASY
ncbi:MAG: peptidoglycan D,D-transpeptidase FtsI family protein [Alphaproteobacteria bacterium]